MIMFVQLLYIIYIRVLCNSEVGKGANIGGGLLIVHPYNIFIGSTKIGKNFEILHETCIGASKKGGVEGIPIVGDNVFVGVGAKVIGPIKIGNNVKIGANSVVHENAPNNSKIYNSCIVKEI
jgi:serine O-acetyltransferase